MNFTPTPVLIFGAILVFFAEAWSWFINASLRSESKRLCRFSRRVWKHVNNFLVRVENRLTRLSSIITAYLLIINNWLYDRVTNWSTYVMTFSITKFKRGRPTPSPFNVGDSVRFKDEKSRNRPGTVKVLKPLGEKDAFLVETKRGQQFTVSLENIREAEEETALKKAEKEAAKLKKAAETLAKKRKAKGKAEEKA